ncbi:hypothetical protein AB7849_15040 [Rhodanobacter sp. 115]|uniref:hypothetical protein n=1 Tax=Rhodanobacter sp. FW021-MT20 TaxID=1162282 RepID=UPI000260DF21|nr:hypothetical protein [Rhodanobacter sp. 115]EIL96204.1 chromate transporter chromate ion transporter (CHR) family protein [Rhodanobacter sp. 115]
MIQVDIPRWSRLNPAVLLLAAGALIAMLRFRIGMVWTLGICAGLGAVIRFL